MTTTPPKPSPQTLFILDKMDAREKKEDERWGEVMENFDLMFSKVAEIDKNQQKSDTWFDMSTQVIEQLLKDQKLIHK